MTSRSNVPREMESLTRLAMRHLFAAFMLPVDPIGPVVPIVPIVPIVVPIVPIAPIVPLHKMRRRIGCFCGGGHLLNCRFHLRSAFGEGWCRLSLCGGRWLRQDESANNGECSRNFPTYGGQGVPYRCPRCTSIHRYSPSQGCFITTVSKRQVLLWQSPLNRNHWRSGGAEPTGATNFFHSVSGSTFKAGSSVFASRCAS
jgi:hypothetical protein